MSHLSIPPILASIIARLAAAVPARSTFLDLLLGAAVTKSGHVTDAILAAGLSRGWRTYYWFLEQGRWSWLRVWAALLEVLTTLFRPAVWYAVIGGVDDRRGGCSLPAGCWWRFRSTPSARADLAPFPVAAHRTGHAELPHPAPSRPIRPSLSAGRRDVAAQRRDRVSCKDTRPGSGRTRCLSVPTVASTSGGPAVRYRLG